MADVRMVIGYDGTAFYGSQSQRGRRTVQSALEESVRTVAPGSGRLVFAGRTDRGVHAVGQVVSGKVAWGESEERLRTAINAVAPADLVVSRVAFAEHGFHARFDALAREYRYRIHVSPAPPALERRFSWWRRRELDPNLAQLAAQRFIGSRNFGSFAGMGRSRTSPPERLERHVFVCEWRCRSVERADAPTGMPESRHELRVVANGFLPQMVRNMLSAVRMVAEGERPVEWIDQLLAVADRSALGEAAPPEGLILWRVYYASSAGETSFDDSLLGDEG